MMNYLWPAMIVLSILFSLFSGTSADVSNAVFSSVQDAVTLTLKMLGAFCFWGGFMRIAERAGITRGIAKLISPLLNRLFKSIRDDEDAKSAVSMNITANLLGLGNAATPLGIAAMHKLQKHNMDKSTAGNDMILFVVLNTACIRLLPTTVAMLRFESQSAAPMEILPATLLVSLCSCAAGIVAARAFERKGHE